MLVLFESVSLSIGALLLVLLACEVGQRFTNAFSEVDDDLIHLDFYLLPEKDQRVLPMLITYSQQPLIAEFFGSLSVTRNQFKRVSDNLICHKMHQSIIITN